MRFVDEKVRIQKHGDAFVKIAKSLIRDGSRYGDPHVKPFTEKVSLYTDMPLKPGKVKFF